MTPGPTTLGIDCGGSATRWAVCGLDGAVLGRGELPPISGHLFNSSEQTRLAAMTAALGMAVSSFLPIAAATMGVTGLSTGSPEASIAAQAVAEAIAVTPDVHDDLWVAYHAAFRPGEGHVVYAGTGSIGLHVGVDGAALRVGGRGHLIDDGGSAFWIGREALRLVLRRIDATGEPGPTRLPLALFAAVGTTAGPQAWDGVRRFVYGGGRSAVGQLARAVAVAADEGDDEALEVLRGAGRELALLAKALTSRAGALPVALLGRAATLHPAILETMRAEVPGARLVDIDAAVAAAAIARERL